MFQHFWSYAFCFLNVYYSCCIHNIFFGSLNSSTSGFRIQPLSKLIECKNYSGEYIYQPCSSLNMQLVEANRSPFSTRDLVQPILTVVLRLLPVSTGCLRFGAPFLCKAARGPKLSFISLSIHAPYCIVLCEPREK